MKILISQPFRQHSPRLLKALESLHHPVQVATLLNTDSGVLPFFVKRFGLCGLKQAFSKRSFHPAGSADVQSTGTLAELRRVLLRKWGNLPDEAYDFDAEQLHDRKVSRKLKEPVCLIGYEKSCLESFRVNHRNGGINILDLAGVYYKRLRQLRERFQVYADTLPPDPLFSNICDRKQQELELADHIIVLSDLIKQDLVSEGFDAAKITVVPLGYDSNLFYPASHPSSSGLLQVLYVGAISYRKGIGELIAVAKKMQIDPVCFTLAGPPADAAPLLAALPSNVTHLPYLPQSRLSHLYREADLFVFPTYMDSFGMVVLEALASGVPVVVSENAGTAVLVKEAGRVIPVGDEQALHTALTTLMNNKQLLNEMSSQAPHSVRNYTWEHYYETVSALVATIINKN